MSKLDNLLDKLNLTVQEKNTWLNTLSKYDYAAIEKRINKSLCLSKEPLLHEIVAGLEKTTALPDRRGWKINCSVCDKMIDYYEVYKHESKCSSIRFIVRKAKELLGKDVPEDYIKNLWEMNDYDFEDTYFFFLDRFISLETNDFQKNLYRGVLNSRGKKE